MPEPANADYDQRFSASVRAFRERKGWSQSDLAKAMRDSGYVHFHPTTVSRIEAGERPVRVGEAGVMARIFDTTISAMLERVEVSQVVQEFMDTLGLAESMEQTLAHASLDFPEYQHLLRARLDSVRHHAGELDDPASLNLLQEFVEEAERILALSVEDVLTGAQEGLYEPSPQQAEMAGEQYLDQLEDQKRGR